MPGPSSPHAALLRHCCSSAWSPLKETQGRFRLHESLSVPLGEGTCVVAAALLCPDARVAIELDSPQQLADADAYRRARHQDRLLQEHGYAVLRLLTEDVARALDAVIQDIVRVLVRSKAEPEPPLCCVQSAGESAGRPAGGQPPAAEGLDAAAERPP